MTSTDTYQLKWHSHSSHLNGSVAALLRSERFTDVVLCTLDGSQIPAHKFILSSCSVYLSSLFEGQRTVTRMGGMIYVVLPPEISSKALKILVEYMYTGETTASNEILDMVIKAGEILKIRGLWRQADEPGGDSTPAERTTQLASVNKQPVKKPEEISKVSVKKDDKLLKAFTPTVQSQGGLPRQMLINPPKLVLIKTMDGTTQSANLRQVGSEGQTILVVPAPSDASSIVASTANSVAGSATTVATTASLKEGSSDDTPLLQILRKAGPNRKYGKRQKTEQVDQDNKEKDMDESEVSSKKSKDYEVTTEVTIKDEPIEWDAKSAEDADRSAADMSHSEMSVEPEPSDSGNSEDDTFMYSPLSCELCAEVFTVPAAWVRHVQGHSNSDHTQRKRRHDNNGDDDSMVLLRCDLCQKHFPNPTEWMRHIQNTHTETEKEKNKRDLKKKERNREYQRAWRQRQKALKKKVSKEEKLDEKRRRHRENQRAYYNRKKGLKENDKNVKELFQNKLDDLQMKFLGQHLRIYDESHECITPKVILHRNTDIPGDGNCLFHSLIHVLQLQISTCDLRRQLRDSPYLNSCNNPQEAYKILSSNNEYGDLDCLYLFAKMYNQNICVHYHYFNVRFCHFKANDTHDWIHLDLRELHFTPYFTDDEKMKQDERKQKQKNIEYCKRYRDKKRRMGCTPGVPAEVNTGFKDKDKTHIYTNIEKYKDSEATTEVTIKDEPTEWDAKGTEDSDQSIADMFHSEMSVKPEPSDDADSEDDTLMYSPLSCELCAEVFTVPAAWVRHVQGHSDSDHTQRKRRHDNNGDDDSMVLLRCDLCQKHFLNPEEWVEHIQNTHTETEGVLNKKCTDCNKVFPSHASLLIHMRTHTGERPFICGLCNKGFSVKSNLLRHLRTLHDQQGSPPRDVEPGPSEVKREA